MAQPQNPLDADDVVIRVDSRREQAPPLPPDLPPLVRPRLMSPVSREELAAYPLGARDQFIVMGDLEETVVPPRAPRLSSDSLEGNPGNGRQKPPEPPPTPS